MQTLDKKEDERGFLAELFTDELKEGLVYYITSKPGAVRGNHWHQRKIEWFVVLEGNVKITLTDNKTKKVTEHIFDAPKKIEKLFVPKNVLHKIENIGHTESKVLGYISEKYNKDDPDTVFPK